MLLSVPLILLGPPAQSPRADGHVAQSSGLVLVCLSVAIGSAEVYSEEEELPSDAAVSTPHSFGTSRGVASSGWSCGTVEWTGACLSVCQSQSVVRKFILKKRNCLLMLLSVPLILLGPP